MAETTKLLSQYDQDQIIKKVYNPEEGTLAVGSFVAGKLGHKILCFQIDAETEQYEFYDNSTLLYTLEVEYVDADRNLLVRVERIV